MDLGPTPSPSSGTVFLSFAAGDRTVTTTRSGSILSVEVPDAPPACFTLADGDCSLRLMSTPDTDAASLHPALLAALDAAIAWHPDATRWRLALDGSPTLADRLVRRGEAIRDGDGLIVVPELFMQHATCWLAQADLPSFPQHFRMTDGKRHPQRPPKPDGLVYARFIPWLGRVLSFRAARMDDLELLHRWMNDPRVAAFWNEDGDLAKHERYLSGILADPHMIPMIGSFDGQPFGYFEVYWAKENRLAPFYDAGDYDRGWHVLIGEDDFRGRAYIGAWLPSLMHCLFLDDCRTQRIVGEPATAHYQQIRNLERSGFARIKTFHFPHKQASLVMLLRERFFADRLWMPAADPVRVPAA